MAVDRPEVAGDRGTRVELLPVDRNQASSSDPLDRGPRADLLPDAEAVPVGDVRRKRVGRELGLVEKKDPQAAPTEERRKSCPPDARSDDDDVVSPGHRVGS
jgi:hypothetical protein